MDPVMKIELQTNKEFTKLNKNNHHLSKTNTCWYISNFISKELESELMDIICNKLPNKQWVDMDHGRLICFDENKTKLPLFAKEICDKAKNANIPFAEKKDPNYIIINEYEVGQGIFPHKDGKLYDPLVAIISLNDIISLNFYKNKPFSNKGFIHNNQQFGDKPLYQIILEPRSCVIFTDKMYNDLFHCIHESNYDLILDSCLNLDIVNGNNKKLKYKVGDKLLRTKTRYSLSVRHVL